MTDRLLTFLVNGLLDLPLWGLALLTLVLTQITIAAVTIFLHRHQAHRALDLHPIVSHFFRFWLWLTTGMVTREWVAVHRKHHAKCETPDDPHSPVNEGIGRLVLNGVSFYRAAATDPGVVERYSHGTPDDWLERHLYSRLPGVGIATMLVADVLMFGAIGLTVWAIQMIWIPFWAAGMINGMGHWWGYRNYDTPDASTNLAPVALWIGGEELHNNHHAFPSSAKFSTKWWEFDIGWLYIRTLSLFGLARVRRIAPTPEIQRGKERIDMETLRAVITARVHVTARYVRKVMLPVLREALCERGYCRQTFKKAKALLVRPRKLMDQDAQAELESMLSCDTRVETVYQFRLRLQEIWDRAATSHESLIQALREWCVQAEATGIKALQEFARTLRGYSLKQAPVAG